MLAVENPVDLRRDDKIVLVQPLDFLSAQGDGDIAPTETDIRVMPFGLGELANFLNKSQRFSEIAKSKAALDAVGIINELPIGYLYLQALGFLAREWRNATATRCAYLLGESVDHIRVLYGIWSTNERNKRLSAMTVG